MLQGLEVVLSCFAHFLKAGLEVEGLDVSREMIATLREKAEAEVAALTTSLADPEVYDDGARVKTLVRELDAAKERAAALMSEWEAASTALETAN